MRIQNRKIVGLTPIAALTDLITKKQTGITTDRVMSFSFTTDGKRFFIAHNKGHLPGAWFTEYLTADAQVISDFTSPDLGTVFAVAPDEGFLATGESEKINLISLPSRVTMTKLQHTPISVRSGLSSQILDVEFSPNGAYLLTAAGDDTVKIWAVGRKQTVLN